MEQTKNILENESDKVERLQNDYFNKMVSMLECEREVRKINKNASENMALLFKNKDDLSLRKRNDELNEEYKVVMEESERLSEEARNAAGLVIDASGDFNGVKQNIDQVYARVLTEKPDLIEFLLSPENYSEFLRNVKNIIMKD